MSLAIPQHIIPQSLAQLCLTLAVGSLCYYVALGAYRLTLHPLARAGIPGPKLAAFTWLWEFYVEVRYQCPDCIVSRPLVILKRVHRIIGDQPEKAETSHSKRPASQEIW